MTDDDAGGGLGGLGGRPPEDEGRDAGPAAAASEEDSEGTPAAEQVARGLRAVVARTGAAAVVGAKTIAKAWRTFRAEFNTEQLQAEYDERVPPRPSEAADHSRVASAAETLRSVTVGTLLSVVLSVAAVIPGTTRFFRALLRAGYRGLYKSTDADAIGHIADGNRIKHKALVWDHETHRYELAAGGENPPYWNASAEGRDEYRVEAGGVPAVWAAGEVTQLGSHVQAETARALDLGRERELFTDATVSDVTVQVPPGTDPGDAVADGGARTHETTREVSLSDPGQFADQVVPIGPADSDAAGNVVSMQKYYETYPSVADSEEMKQQEIRGRLSAQQEDLTGYAFKMLLVAVAGIVLSLAVVTLLPMVLGGGGGGGGTDSFLPLMLDTANLLGGW